MRKGLTIQRATLPVTLLPNHCEQGMVVSAQALTALTQTEAVELQVVAPQKHAEHVHPLIEIADGQWQAQPQHICGGGLCFDLSLQNGFEKTDGQKRLGQPRPKHLHVHSVGKIAQPPLKGLIHGIDPVQEGIRITGQKVVITSDGRMKRTAGLDGLLGMLHRIPCQLEQRTEHLEIP